MEILRAEPQDAAKLTEIAFAAKRHWGYPEHWIASWAHVLTISPRSISEQETYAARIDGEPIGFYSLSCGQDQMRLEHLWVIPRLMRKGVGRALFSHAVGRTRELGFGSLVIESDPNAAGFYKRMGALVTEVSVTEIEGQRRELPVLLYKIHQPSQLD